MNEEKSSDAGRTGGGWVVFFAGFILSLIYGWVVFPNLLYSQRNQPLNFSHVAHQDSSCQECHSYREDGTFNGIPKVDKCKECHDSMMGTTENERIMVEEYIQKDLEIPWLVYSWQPDNVYFSHAPHKPDKVKCTECHRDVTQEVRLPVYRENRLTGYSDQTMKMDVCEKCHVRQLGSNSCQACHK